MKSFLLISALLLLPAFNTFAAQSTQQEVTQKEAVRVATRERLRRMLDSIGPLRGIEVAFRQSEKQPFNFTGTMRDGAVNADAFEIVISVTADNTISFRIYPHYKGGYINLEKAKNSVGLMRLLLTMSNRNFLFWGIDDSADVFAGYTFTLESGFPAEAIEIVLRSIRNLDGFIGQMRPFIDNTPNPGSSKS